jgi:hypothetical protein
MSDALKQKVALVANPGASYNTAANLTVHGETHA